MCPTEAPRPTAPTKRRPRWPTIAAGLGAATGDEDAWLPGSVLRSLADAGSAEAGHALRRYAVIGRFWWTTVDLTADAAEVVAAHTDAELRESVYDVEPWRSWAITEPRVAAILEESRPGRAESRPSVHAGSSDDLVALFDGPATARNLAALRELGRRGDLRVFDLAENPSLRNRFGGFPGMSAALAELGPRAVERARRWIDDPALVDFATTVLAAHGGPRDAPLLYEAAEAVVAAREWCRLEQPAEGLGRLGHRPAADLLRHAWEEATHSWCRREILAGLAGCAPEDVAGYADEARDDCEPRVRELAESLVNDLRGRRSTGS